jgi:hypothetical protein
MAERAKPSSPQEAADPSQPSQPLRSLKPLKPPLPRLHHPGLIEVRRPTPGGGYVIGGQGGLKPPTKA